MNRNELDRFEIKKDKQNIILDAAIAFEWMKWMETIPYLSFPSHWQVRIVPPFINGIIRFFIKTDKMENENRISVYLDCYNIAGFMGRPYWEVYPISGSTERFFIEETDPLLECIARAIKEQEEKSSAGA